LLLCYPSTYESAESHLGMTLILPLACLCPASVASLPYHANRLASLQNNNPTDFPQFEAALDGAPKGAK